jgi:hypothetical protein
MSSQIAWFRVFWADQTTESSANTRFCRRNERIITVEFVLYVPHKRQRSFTIGTHSNGLVTNITLLARGPPLSEFKHEYVAPAPIVGDIDQANHTIRGVGIGDVQGLRYSSPRPWMLGIAISLTMWVFIGWLIWVAVSGSTIGH